MPHKRKWEWRYSSTHSVHGTRSPSWMAASHPSNHTEEKADRGPATDLDIVAKRKILAIARNQTPVIQPVASSLRYLTVLSVYITFQHQCEPIVNMNGKTSKCIKKKYFLTCNQEQPVDFGFLHIWQWLHIWH